MTESSARAAIAELGRMDEGALLSRLIAAGGPDAAGRARIAARGADLVAGIRASDDPGLMEVFLAEYGLSTDEGIALMCLAEALLRVPDTETIDALIEDKIAPSDWGRHLGHSSSSLVNASTWALMLTGRVLDDEQTGVAGALRGAIKRLGEPVIRTATARAMRELGSQFVLGETIGAAMKRAERREAMGFTYSYDMLGEAARTGADARRYHLAYSNAITALAPACRSDDIGRNPGISVKLSALHPRYEEAKRDRVMEELVARTRSLAMLAASAGIGFNIDAEEADRLDLSLDVIAAVLADPALKGWHGFGVVVQAYGKRAGAVIDWLHALATRLDRKIMVRLVKGAYWDSEIKRAQVLGLDHFPVFTRKAATDVSYIVNARKLLSMTDRIYPQFATHNAHTVAGILEMAGEARDFEFQRLHGMGERLHDLVHGAQGTRCRIYAPVGAHRDLLAYLVRRLLENGANSSFVHQIVDTAITPSEVSRDPFAEVEATLGAAHNPQIRTAHALFRPLRANARGWDLTDRTDLAAIEAARAPYRDARFTAAPMLATPQKRKAAAARQVLNPADAADVVGDVREATPAEVEAALAAAGVWAAPARERAAVLGRAAALYEEDFGRLFALAAREAGKTLPDAVAELREAVDFLHFYGAEASRTNPAPRGVFACISPWNFPLAIFTGQIAAALAAGNAVIAKPAEQTPLMAAAAVELLHRAGVPEAALQLLPGSGEVVGAALTRDPRIAGICFTGGTATAQAIHRSMANALPPDAPLIAETGGLNAMIVDSTALPEQAVRDILASAFQSAGQRCSALRCLYLQADVADTVLTMLKGAMDELALGDPWALATDIGPVIDAEAAARINAHVATASAEGRLIKALAPAKGPLSVGPALVRINGIGALGEEIFGPVLHVATYRAEEIDAVVAAINATGYGLTFGLHTRIDDRVQQVVEGVNAGNIYVNRNQIGAIVGSQPFGGEGMSGTGPKAGGPLYLSRFATGPVAGIAQGTRDLPGPTGESNRLTIGPRGPVLCLGPAEQLPAQAAEARAAGCTPIDAVGADPKTLAKRDDFAAVMWWGDRATARECRKALAARKGAILPLVTGPGDGLALVHERHLCVDTTASGGNTQLLAAAEA